MNNPLDYYKTGMVRSEARANDAAIAPVLEDARIRKLWCRLDSATYNALKQAAKRENRSMTQQLIVALHSLYPVA